jgi:hypothetical protein
MLDDVAPYLNILKQTQVEVAYTFIENLPFSINYALKRGGFDERLSLT